MHDQIGLNLLNAALVAAQKLHKKLRQLANRGDCSEQDVADARAALESLREISVRHGVRPVDVDSRAERQKRKE